MEENKNIEEELNQASDAEGTEAEVESTDNQQENPEIITEPTEGSGQFQEKYIRLFAEFDNYKRRVAREKIELTKTAGESVIKSLIVILDDFERAISASASLPTEAQEAVKGFELIYTKLAKTLEQKGLKAIDNPTGNELNTDFHEAITQVPAPTPELSGKIIDQLEKGYLLNDKVIRYAKVVVGN